MQKLPSSASTRKLTMALLPFICFCVLSTSLTLSATTFPGTRVLVTRDGIQPIQYNANALPYDDLIAVDPANINMGKQHHPPSTTAVISNTQFKQYVQDGFDHWYKSGLYDFVVLQSEPNSIRLLWKGPGRSGDPSGTIVPTGTGHTTMVTATEYAALRAGTLRAKWAGEIFMARPTGEGEAADAGVKPEWWSSKSGHFKPDDSSGKRVFATHWGLNLIRYHPTTGPALRAFFNQGGLSTLRHATQNQRTRNLHRQNQAQVITEAPPSVVGQGDNAARMELFGMDDGMMHLLLDR